MLFTFFFLRIFVVYSTIYVCSSVYVNVWGRPVSFSVNAPLDSHYEKYVEQKDYKPFLRNKMCSQAHCAPLGILPVVTSVLPAAAYLWGRVSYFINVQGSWHIYQFLWSLVLIFKYIFYFEPRFLKDSFFLLFSIKEALKRPYLQA